MTAGSNGSDYGQDRDGHFSMLLFAGLLDVRMRDLLHRQVHSQNLRIEHRRQLNLSHLPEGIYILQIIGEDFKQEVKVVKE